jgi:hypothetical protein
MSRRRLDEWYQDKNGTFFVVKWGGPLLWQNTVYLCTSTGTLRECPWDKWILKRRVAEGMCKRVAWWKAPLHLQDRAFIVFVEVPR